MVVGKGDSSTLRVLHSITRIFSSRVGNEEKQNKKWTDEVFVGLD